MAVIRLTQGQSAIVDDADYEWLSRWKWCADWSPSAKKFYVMRKDGRMTVRMHRFIMGLQRGDKRMVDHINLNPLDNRRSNLRIATAAENIRNRGMRIDCSSGFKGVRKNRTGGKWAASIRVDGKVIGLGSRSTPEEAFALYVEASAKYHGNFGRYQ